jgi:hypothetical protein
MAHDEGITLDRAIDQAIAAVEVALRNSARDKATKEGWTGRRKRLLHLLKSIVDLLDEHTE